MSYHCTTNQRYIKSSKPHQSRHHLTPNTTTFHNIQHHNPSKSAKGKTSVKRPISLCNPIDNQCQQEKKHVNKTRNTFQSLQKHQEKQTTHQEPPKRNKNKYRSSNVSQNHLKHRYTAYKNINGAKLFNASFGYPNFLFTFALED